MRGRTIRSNIWLAAAAVVLVVAAALLGWRLAGVQAAEHGAETRRPPQVRLASLAGGMVGFEDFEGQVVVVDFWATWCGPCVLQAKILGSLHRDLDGEVQFLAVNLGEERDTIERYLADHHIPYPVLMDPEEQLGDALQIYVLPTVMLLDRNGRIAFLRPGISDRGTLAGALAAIGVDARERPAA